MALSTSAKRRTALPLTSAQIEKQITNRLPVWLRIADATRLFGIGRSSLYELIEEGKIKSSVLRKEGSTRGIRLLSTASLSAYIESLAQQTANAA